MNIIFRVFRRGVTPLLCSLCLSASASTTAANAEISGDSSENDETDGNAEENHEWTLEEHVSDGHKLRNEEARDVSNRGDYAINCSGECYWVSHFEYLLSLVTSDSEESSNNAKKNHTDGKSYKENKGTVEEHVSDTYKRLYEEVHDKFDGH